MAPLIPQLIPAERDNYVPADARDSGTTNPIGGCPCPVSREGCDRIEALHFVFDRPPGHEPARFIEVEAPDGRSVRVGEWRHRPDGLVELVITPLDFRWPQ